MAGLSGKVVQVELINTTQPVVSLKIEQYGIQVDADYAGTGDVLIRGTPLDLLVYMRSSGDSRAAVTGNMEIKGDLGLAQDFQRLLHRLEIDWEEQQRDWLVIPWQGKHPISPGRALIFTAVEK